MKINCIAIDDEPLALQQLAGYIQKTPFLELKAVCKSAFEAMKVISENKVDLMFVDIQMPDLSGIDFVKSWGEKQKVIFTTAYQEFALEGFKVDALDYLLKPFGYDEFLKSAKKARNYFELIEKVENKHDTNDEYLFVKTEYKILKIKFADILYIEGLKEYVKIVVGNNKPILSLLTLKHLEEKLPQNYFMRVHRSFIVNLHQVKTIERGRIIFDKVNIPISEPYKVIFQKFLDNNFI